jgi:hypothetical protein
MKLYVYCLTESVTLDQLPPGISDLAVRILTIDDFAVLVSDFDSDAIPVTRENALAHAAVVRSVLDRTTPLPFRFGTLVTEQQLRSYIAAHKPSLKTNLDLVRGCVEMSVKIIWNVSQDDDVEREPGEGKQGIGARFLQDKRREILGDERRAAQAAEISTWLRESLVGLVRDEQVTTRPSEKLLLAAAHLVERTKIKQYRDRIAEARAKRPELHFLLSGPWPPYSFANIELEFKSQFGVS